VINKLLLIIYELNRMSQNQNIEEKELHNSQQYKSKINNILLNHYAEIKLETDDIIHPIISISRKKLKELIIKQNDIFKFIRNPDRRENILVLADKVFNKYGYKNVMNENKLYKDDLNLDVSMIEVRHFFDEELEKLEGGLENYLKQTKWIFNEYKLLGEEVLRLETQLLQKIEILDKLHNQLVMLTNLTDNEVLPELIDSFTKYADSEYKSIKIEDTYKELIFAYKKWNICRRIITLHSNFKDETDNPQCTICLTEPVITAIVPCGHTFCGNCIKKQNTSCYICRGTIRDRIKLYFT
jgi:hypothetical protein